MTAVTSSVLLVAATRAEAADLPADLPLVVTGIDKTPAAVAVTRALLTDRKSVV